MTLTPSNKSSIPSVIDDEQDSFLTDPHYSIVDDILQDMSIDEEAFNCNYIVDDNEHIFTGEFLGSVLLSKFKMHRDQIISDFKKIWGIEVDKVIEHTKTYLGLKIGDLTVSFSLKNAHSNDEIQCATNSESWEKVESVAKKFVATINVYVRGDADLLDIGTMYVKALAVCCHQKNALAVSANDVLHDIESYLDSAKAIDQDLFPVKNHICFNFYESEYGLSICSFGLELFGHYDLEVFGVDEKQDKEHILSFLETLCLNIITNKFDPSEHTYIEDTAEHKYKIEIGPSVAYFGDTVIKLIAVKD